MKMLHWLIAIAVVAVAFTQFDTSARAKPDGDRVIAIDVLLLPDAKMLEQAKAANTVLRSSYPQGYALGEDQAAHITLIHRYVHEKDLPAIEAAVAKVSEQADPLEWELTANSYRYGMWSGLAITNISINRIPNLDQYQVAIAQAVQRFAVDKGTDAAFSTSRELPKIQRDIIGYVENFIPASSGDNYSPHVTVGIAPEQFVLELKEKPFETFRFKAAGVAIYQLGNFGTAQKKLWVWDDKSEAK